MSKKSILYIITKSVWAGAGKYVYDLATGLPQTRFRPIVAAGGTSLLAEKIISANIPYFEIKRFQRNINIFKDFFAFFEILFLLFKTKPDIIHVSSAKAGGITGIAVFIYKLLTTNYYLLSIFTVHGWTFNESRPKWQISLIKFFSKLTCKFYDKIICVSKYDRLIAIENKVVPEEKIIVIHNGIKTNDYAFLTKEEARKILGHSVSKLGIECLVIGTIGEFTKNKGQEYLIDAFLKPELAKLPVKIFIIGFGEKREILKEKILYYSLEDRIFLIDNLPEASKYLKAFDIFILPSLKEGLPYVLLEAGMAEIPVIATNVGGIPEIIKDNKDGWLVNPGIVNELAVTVKKLSQDKTRRKNFAKNLNKKIINEFSFEKMLNSTLASYNK
ncbi:MAG: glycosyltransferase [Patescibacteria group bacterium]